MPNRSDYQPLAQSADIDEDLETTQQRNRRGLKHPLRPGPIDLSKLDAAFKRWTESIAQKVKGKKKAEPDNSKKEILTSVFDPYVPPHVIPLIEPVKTLDHGPPMTQSDYDALVLSVKRAISEGVHPKMISKGSSGSYFARAKLDGKAQTVAVFKPKDEEPYGRLNPKTTKWLHRKFRWLIPFGRACLIPNLSYVSEAAASLLDDRLNLNIVPKTQLVSFSSTAFFYDWLDRNAAKKGKPLPEKIGSMQVFMHGYQDASDFLRKHPWPGRSIADTFDDSTHRTGKLSKRFLSALQIICGKTGNEDDMNDWEDPDEERVLYDASEDDGSSYPFYWSGALQESFREELEKLIILDYIMRNTDRGADNYMIKYCEGEHEKSLVDVAPSPSASLQVPTQNGSRIQAGMSATPSMTASTSTKPPSPPTPPASSNVPYTRHPHIHIAAIDNSLAFPHEHPRGWRSYTYGWLYLPVSLIGQPFSEKTRNHFLPLLTSKAWWEETTYQLRKIFVVDEDFNWKMFRRQLAVLKGQAWNVVQCLKHQDEGPLELTRRQKVLVWDDEVEVEDDTILEIFNPPLTLSPRPSVRTMPLPTATTNHRRARSHSSADFPPPMRRTATDGSGVSRPVPFVSKLPRVHPGTSGVTVLEHMERVDAVEAGLRRLAMDDDVIEEEDEDAEEVDVGMTASTALSIPVGSVPSEGENANTNTTPTNLPSSPVITPNISSDRHADTLIPPGDAHVLGTTSSASSSEEDLVAMSKSTPQLEAYTYPRVPMSASFHGHSHSQWPSGGGGASRTGASGVDGEAARQSLEWMQGGEGDGVKKKTMIVERLETIDTNAFFSCW